MDLKQTYRRYVECLNARDWERLGEFVADDVTHNMKPLGLTGYRTMLEQDVANIPDLQFTVELAIVEGDYLASRLRFDCSPKGLSSACP